MRDFEAARVRRVTCTYHCSACGLHFHSLNAFDAHRTGDFGSTDPDLGRRCLYPFDLDGTLVALTQDGECRMHGVGGRVNAGIRVWTHAGDLARFRRHLASERSDEAESKALATR